MRRRVSWLGVSTFMVTVLVLTACGQATPKQEENTPTGQREQTGATVAKPEEVTGQAQEPTNATPVQEEKTAAAGEDVPRYGGTVTLSTPNDPLAFDGAIDSGETSILPTNGSSRETGPGGPPAPTRWTLPRKRSPTRL